MSQRPRSNQRRRSGAASRGGRQSPAEVPFTPALARIDPHPEIAPPEIGKFPGLEIRFPADTSLVILTGDTIVAAIQSGARRESVNRFFSIPDLKSLRLHRKKGEVRLEFASYAARRDRLAALAAAIQAPRPSTLPLTHEELLLSDEGPPTIRVTRAAGKLTLWHIDALTSGMFRLVHPSLANEHIRPQLLEELATIPGVAPRTIYLPLWGSDSLIVFVQPHRIAPESFAEILDPVITRCLASGRPVRLAKPGEGLVNANLALAPISDFLFPSLGIVNVALMGLIGVSNVPKAVLGLRQGKFTLELLSTVIAALSVFTMEFLPAAIMYWLTRYWPRRATELYKLHHTRFVARYQFRPRRVWTERDGISVETRVEELTPSSVVTLTAGDIVPGDGVVVEGRAQIDERILTGRALDQERTVGSEVFASTRVVDGTIRMRIKTLGNDTAASRVARWHRQALSHSDFPLRTVAPAEKTVLPALLISGLAFLQGGFPMAKATIRPDYATGPAVSEKLGSLATIINAANRGILLKGDAPVEALAGPACLVFDDSVAWNAPEDRADVFSDLSRQQGLTETIFFARTPEQVTQTTAAQLGFDAYVADASEAAKLAYIESKQREGRIVIYLGNTRAEKKVAALADVAISVSEMPFSNLEDASIALLSPDAWKFLELRALAAGALKDNRTAFQINLAPNVAAVLSAFFFTTPAYASILLTNFGTFANYLLSGSRLQAAGED